MKRKDLILRSLPCVSLATLVLTASGCAALLAAGTPKPRVADNPLTSGQPLESVSKSDVGTVREPDCQTWPFEDNVSVSVTENQICISTRKHVASTPSWTGEPTSNRTEFFRVVNDANEGGQISVKKVHAAKVSSCFNRGYNAKISIWALDYKGCAPNNGTVTAATKSLRVGDEEWSFAGASESGAESGDTSAGLAPSEHESRSAL
jgi:hypothetical protein